MHCQPDRTRGRAPGARAGRRWTVALVLLALAGIPAGGCKPREEGGAGHGAVEVTVVTATPTTVPVTLTQVGQLQASQVVEVRARVQGFLVGREFTEGKRVAAGQPLFRIDPKPFLADLEIARARVAQAEARLTRADRELMRVTEMARQNAASDKELDAAKSEALQARADVNLYGAMLAKAELEHSYTTVASPFAGVVGEAFKDVGALVDGGANSLLAKVAQLDPIHVSLTVSEREGLALDKGIRSGAIAVPAGGKVAVRLALADGTPYGHAGEINYVDPEVDPQTGTARLRARVPNPDYKLAPGLFVRVTLSGFERRGAILVPQRSVLQTPGGQVVYVVAADGKVAPRPVVLGEWVGDQWVVLEGLSAGDRVVSDGVLKVRPGMQVQIARADAAAAPAAVPAAVPVKAPATAPATAATR